MTANVRWCENPNAPKKTTLLSFATLGRVKGTPDESVTTAKFIGILHPMLDNSQVSYEREQNYPGYFSIVTHSEIRKHFNLETRPKTP